MHLFWIIGVNYRAEKHAADQVVESIEAAGGRAFAAQGDVGRAEDIERLFTAVDERLGTLSALVNNAGIIGPTCRVEDLGLSDLQRVLDVNVVGLILCSQQAVRRMSTRNGGSGGAIVNVSSGSAYIGGAGENVHYAVSKGAVNSFSIGLSQEVAGEGIRVNSVSPGLTRTDMVSEAGLEHARSTIPMGRAGEPEEIAQSIAWLLSDAAAYVAGANIRVAGGRP